ncbi:MAG TPA: DNA-processing protein DprA [Candidatus Paceibacterota bacterium]
MNSIKKVLKKDFPPLLREICDPPEHIYIRGDFPLGEYKYLTVVGSRRFSDYGKQAVDTLIEGLRGLPVVIVSGLAYGIDARAHEAALRAGLKTIAVPGSGLNDDVLYPKENLRLAQNILESGGVLMSPFESDLPAAPWTFPERNRIMAGMSHATLVVEASLITSRLATDYNRDVFAVPGSIFSSKSAGPHQLIRSGATPITCADDLVEALGFNPAAARIVAETTLNSMPDSERTVWDALSEPLDRDALIGKTGLSASAVNAALSMLEIRGLIEELLGQICRK